MMKDGGNLDSWRPYAQDRQARQDAHVDEGQEGDSEEHLSLDPEFISLAPLRFCI